MFIKTSIFKKLLKEAYKNDKAINPLSLLE